MLFICTQKKIFPRIILGRLELSLPFLLFFVHSDTYSCLNTCNIYVLLRKKHVLAEVFTPMSEMFPRSKYIGLNSNPFLKADLSLVSRDTLILGSWLYPIHLGVCEGSRKMLTVFLCLGTAPGNTRAVFVPSRHRSQQQAPVRDAGCDPALHPEQWKERAGEQIPSTLMQKCSHSELTTELRITRERCSKNSNDYLNFTWKGTEQSRACNCQQRKTEFGFKWWKSKSWSVMKLFSSLYSSTSRCDGEMY